MRNKNYRTPEGIDRFVGLHGVIAPQRENELLDMIDAAIEKGVRSYLEIGLEKGITFHTVVSRVLQRYEGARCVGVDKPIDALAVGGPENIATVCADLVHQGYQPTIVWGDSANPAVVSAVNALGPFDFIFIDGDHTLEGVRRDFENYGRYATKLVGFHDIATDWEKGIEVHTFWNELKKLSPNKCTEILGAPGAPNPGMGIGLFHL